MKKHIIGIVVALMAVTTLFSQNNKSMNYIDHWTRVQEYDNKSLPKSAALEVEKIMQKAIAEKNSPQVIKALIYQAEYNLVIDSENNTFIFDSLNDMLSQSNDIVERSVFNSMLGELYLKYYQSNSWEISKRTDLGDFVPKDMKEWTKNIFYNKSVEHFNASIDNQEALLEAKVESYGDVVELRKSSRTFFPTMYDFLSKRRIESLSSLSSDKDLSSVLLSKNIDMENIFAKASVFTNIDFNVTLSDYNLWALVAYSDYMKSLIKRDMKESLVLIELQKLNYLERLSQYHDKYAAKALEQLLAEYEGEPISVEIVDQLVSVLLEDNSFGIQENTDNEDANIKPVYDLLKEYVSKYSDYERIGLLENRLAELLNPELKITGKSTYGINSEKLFEASYRNLSSQKLKLYKLHSQVDVLMYKYNTTRDLMKGATFVKDVSLVLKPEREYQYYTHEFGIDINEPGIYLLTIDEKENLRGESRTNYIFCVSDLAVFSRATAKDKYEFFVMNRITGKPVEGAKVDIYKLPRNWSSSDLVKETSILTNKIGLAKYDKEIPNNDVFYNATLGDDKGSQLVRLPGSSMYNSYSGSKQSRDVVNIFTDRMIYRPGQTIFFKAIATSTDGEKTGLITGRDFDFGLYDVNGKEISKQSLRVNEFGSVTGEFVIPTDRLNGGYSIRSAGGSVYFRVEEYKRPTFDITFEKIADTYSFDEEVVVKGKAESFSGINLQDAVVNYKIIRQHFRWRLWGGGSSHFDDGAVMTDGEGNFEITFIPRKGDAKTIINNIYSFVVEATVTDVNGESQSSTTTIVVGDVSMILSIDIKDKFEKGSNEKINISAINLDGEKVEASGEYKIYLLTNKDSLGSQVAEGVFEAGEQKDLKEQLVKLPSGKYRIILKSQDDKAREIEAQSDVIIYSLGDKKPPIETNDWLVVKNDVLSSSKQGEIIFGASQKVNVLYELWQENNLLERKWIELNNENKKFVYPYKDAYKNGITLMLNYVKDEKYYSHSINMLLEDENKDLNISLDVFRDKIRPGSKEEWRISVKDGNGNPTIAEVLASMYDMSLDKIYNTPAWMFSPNIKNRYWSRASLNRDGSDLMQSIYASMRYQYKTLEDFEFDFFNWYGFELYFSSMRMLTRSSAMMKQNIVVGYASAPKLEAADQDMSIGGVLQTEESTAEDTYGNVSNAMNADNIRRNFDETAFFFPQLVTNQKGETQISFTVPDTNTKWKFRLLAHDKELNVGYAEAVSMSQKELMVTPNLPRFVRHGDKTSISTKISNLSDDKIEGVVAIEFFNPATDEVIEFSILDDIEKSFVIDKGESVNASWLFDVPSDIDMLGVRIVARSDNFSDGEQHVLVVLPNRMLVTEVMRIDVNGGEDKKFVFDELINKSSDSRQDYRVTLEFTSNPAWYAVQSLPVLSTPDNDNSVSWFAAYYANKIGLHIGEAYPKVKAMVSAWKKQGGTTETLLSNLQKNEELKDIILEETPWVMEAINESEQKERLSLLFDTNRGENIIAKTAEQLNKLQTYDGGWAWFEGMRANVSVTQYILFGLSELTELGLANDYRFDQMVASAIKFVDGEALDRFERFKRNNKSWKKSKHISTQDLEYLYIRSQYKDYEISDKHVEMMGFYKSVITDNWTKFNLYERSLIAILLNNDGNYKVANDIIKSYREHATINDELGMYWANNRSSVFMSQSAVSVHTFIMRAFKEVGYSAEEMYNMNRWLLKQKQTQLWESTHATLDAVYTLLSTSSDWFESGGESVVSVGGNIVEPGNKDIGTGYFKESWIKSEIKPEMGNVDVSHKGNTPAWGALYYQYYEDLDNIVSTDATLDVKKSLFIEKTDSDGSKLTLINDDDILKIGDKVVVRVTVRTDRDMEFVYIKDMRAACFEPVEQISGVRWNGGSIYYQSSKDASTNYYFDSLPRGTYVFEYQVVVNREGQYSNGITTIQSMYAPDFTSHTGGVRINVK